MTGIRVWMADEWEIRMLCDADLMRAATESLERSAVLVKAVSDGTWCLMGGVR